MNVSSLNLNKITELQNKNTLGLLEAQEGSEVLSFQDLYMNAIKEAEALGKISEDYSVQLASGQLENLHEAMIAGQKADVSLQLVIQIRNKVLDAYREITRMQI